MIRHWTPTLKKTRTPEGVVNDFKTGLDQSPFPLTGAIEQVHGITSFYACCDSGADSLIFAIRRLGQLHWPVSVIMPNRVSQAVNEAELTQVLETYTQSEDAANILATLCATPPPEPVPCC